ncbi:Chitinase OS=Streptomyces glaucescens OX=1907 GN=SGLAU_05820 PE=4 SV=1 [Streptomyces glaucescens]
MKTLISVGGWAETGGCFDDSGKRVNSGGFYSMATNADGSAPGRHRHLRGLRGLIRKYGSTASTSTEYPTTMKDAGNPLDWSFANAGRAGLVKGYAALMKTLREKLERAGAADGKRLLSVAAPSGYLLRAWRPSRSRGIWTTSTSCRTTCTAPGTSTCGPNASLFDDGKRRRAGRGERLRQPACGGIGYLNTDWACRYFRGSCQAGRVKHRPAHTRGHKNVQGGTDGLTTAAAAAWPGRLGLTKCGSGAVAIDDLWHDKDDERKESPAGSNPMWHAKNLEKAIVGDYVTRVRLPAGTELHPAPTPASTTPRWGGAVSWNAEKKSLASPPRTSSRWPPRRTTSWTTAASAARWCGSWRARLRLERGQGPVRDG